MAGDSEDPGLTARQAVRLAVAAMVMPTVSEIWDPEQQSQDGWRQTMVIRALGMADTLIARVRSEPA